MSVVDRHDPERERIDPQQVVDVLVGAFLILVAGFIVFGLGWLALLFARLLS